ncbi:GxxExxY protein [Novosphingobium cyanobacteriorum]|uniref:GxxExxY protein n=1 Tax=Novosphingobium cyanobacteriorum TaxID=3024215 RepID=A0ABT6CHK6_9SPHN|nr:GxxExxY protein [Novosphingobium cyanobacteriorum]MDF8333410.1 GxxExxY protein [Novosphingobium cyanobacteriorum]
MRQIDALTAAVIDEAIRIHRELGPGLFESVYESILAGRLDALGMRIERQLTLPVEFDGKRFDAAFRVDMRVEGCLVLEIKAVDQLSKAHERQLITYLRLMKQPVGLLLNFSGATMKEGIRRMVNNYAPD